MIDDDVVIPTNKNDGSISTSDLPEFSDKLSNDLALAEKSLGDECKATSSTAKDDSTTIPQNYDDGFPIDGSI